MKEPEKIQFEVRLTESQRGAQVAVAAHVDFQVHSKKWHAAAVGLGANRADAVADLANQKFPKILASAVTKQIAFLEETSPKASEQPEVPATGCEEETCAGKPEVAQAADVQSSKPRKATRRSTRRRSSLTARKGTRRKPRKSSKKPAGIKPAPTSASKLPF